MDKDKIAKLQAQVRIGELAESVVVERAGKSSEYRGRRPGKRDERKSVLAGGSHCVKRMSGCSESQRYREMREGECRT